MTMEVTPTAIAHSLVSNLLTSVLVFADRFVLMAGENYKLVQLLRNLFVYSFLFFLRLFIFFFPSLTSSAKDCKHLVFRPPNAGEHTQAIEVGGSGRSSIERALLQVLFIMTSIPVNSRKYELIRSLAEKLIDENLMEGSKALLGVNRTVLSAAFARTLSLFEVAVVDLSQYGGDRGGPGGVLNDDVIDYGVKKGNSYGLNRVLGMVRYYGHVLRRGGRSAADTNRLGTSAEKLAAELLWLARKLEASGGVEEAVTIWASASNLSWLVLSAEPRLQASLIKLSAFLFKKVKEMGKNRDAKDQHRQTMMKMLISWLPFLCRASNGTEAPVLDASQRAELETILEEAIEMLEEEEDQERVLSLWLHHFSQCSSSDWPNLHACYDRWCTAARKLLLLNE